MAKKAAAWAQAHDGEHLRFAARTDFTARLRRAMEDAGLTQSELARRIWGSEPPDAKGYTPAKNRDRISKYLSGQTVPDGSTLKQISQVLGVPEAELSPEIVGSRYEREHPELRITMIAGHRDKVHITINTVVDIAVAVQMAALIRDAESRAPSGLELREREHSEQSLELTIGNLPLMRPELEPSVPASVSSAPGSVTPPPPPRRKRP